MYCGCLGLHRDRGSLEKVTLCVVVGGPSRGLRIAGEGEGSTACDVRGAALQECFTLISPPCVLGPISAC